MDDDGYSRKQGAGPHPAEATYEGFLQLTGDLYDWGQLGGKPLSRNEASQSVKVEGNPQFVQYAGARAVNSSPPLHLLIIWCACACVWHQAR